MGRSETWRGTAIAVAGLMVISLGISLVGIRRDLPFPDVDEPVFVQPAVHMAATGDLDPHWFGHPGSTVIYPLAIAFHVVDAAAHGGPLLTSNTAIATRFRSSPETFYLVGRLWATMLAIGSIPLIFLIGRRAFGPRVALMGAALWVLIPLAIHYGRIVRTDSAALFFGLLGLWLVLRLFDHPSPRNACLAGVAIGCAISSRYFMLTLLIVLIGAVVAVRRTTDARRVGMLALIGIGTAVVTFVITTPFFFLDWSAMVRTVAEESGAHLGHDGLSPLGNLRWYLASSIPHTLSWAVALSAAAGAALVVVRREPAQMMLLGFAVVFLAGVCTSSLHWDRWVIQILPVIVLLSVFAVDAGVSALSSRYASAPHRGAAALATAFLALAIAPASAVVALERQESHPSTRTDARTWIVRNLPVGSRIAGELKTAPLARSGLVALQTEHLASARTVQHYVRHRFCYFMINRSIDHNFMVEARRYPRDAAFYRTLQRRTHLIRRWDGRSNNAGPAISLLELVSPACAPLRVTVPHAVGGPSVPPHEVRRPAGHSQDSTTQ